MAKSRTPEKTRLKPLAPERLRNMCAPGALPFKSTKDIEPVDHLPGQARALNAMDFGANMAHSGYNLFVLGSQGTGRHSAVANYLAKKASAESAPDDWAYVYNFSSVHHPSAIRLPAGVAPRFRDAMEDLIDDLCAAIPEVFNSEEYRDKRRAIDLELEEKQEREFQVLNEKTRADNVAILRTPMGFALAPTSGDEVLKPEEFKKLPKDEQEKIGKKIELLQSDLAATLEKLPGLQREHRDNVRSLNAELTASIVDTSIKVIADQFAPIEAIQQRLSEVREDLIENTELFLEHASSQADTPFPESSKSQRADSRFNRYRVNVMVANDVDGDLKGAPVVSEDHPTLAKLVGRVEHLAQFGALITDFTMIRPGGFHRANGGYLVLDARKVLSEPFAWEAMKRALQGEAIKIVSASDQLGLSSTISLEPEPIPLKVKVVLIGERILYYLLCALDPDFSTLFKVEVDFDDEIERTDENTELYARLIATLVTREKLKSFNAAAVARVIDEASRFAGDSERLSLSLQKLTDLLREADHWATAAGKKTVTVQQVEKAIEEQIQRSDLIREKSLKEIERGTVLIDVDGGAVGQINGLSVIGLGSFSFGKPTRITARVRPGSGKVVDIERETKLGGALHSKGVLILSGYLSATYAPDMPLSLWASIVFEQSYGGVDGDSASSAELYALMSALSGVPINQSYAVTGSVNQHGEVQPIGGVNEKIEGFFDVCKASGFTRQQGVLIPEANVKHLMLRPDIVKAAKDGLFHIYLVKTVTEGIELLTGTQAGVRDAKTGEFSPNTINAKIEDTLKRFADVRKKLTDKEDESK